MDHLFPGLYTSTPDFKTKWAPAVAGLKALLANKTIFGFALGDELIWGGVTPANLITYANTVRHCTILTTPTCAGASVVVEHGPRFEYIGVARDFRLYWSTVSAPKPTR